MNQEPKKFIIYCRKCRDYRTFFIFYTNATHNQRINFTKAKLRCFSCGYVKKKIYRRQELEHLETKMYGVLR